MAGAGPTQLLTLAKWAVEEDAFLSDFIDQSNLPHLALVTKGQFLTVGVPNLANPHLKPYVLLHSRQKVRKVLAQVVRVREGKRRMTTEQQIAVPEHYGGYFEILSEDGRPVKCLESVQELYQKFPELCLVRQRCKAYLPDSDGELRNLYRTRTLHEGEVLTLVGQFKFKKVSFLRCFDDLGHSVYLKLGQKGKYSPVAQADAITGVHSMGNLMNKRLPLTVKLIQGSFPPELVKVTNGGPIILRILTVFHEDLVYAYCLSRERQNQQFFSIPSNAHLKVAPVTNQAEVKNCHEFQALVNCCDDNFGQFFGSITLYNDHKLFYDHAHANGATENGSSRVNSADSLDLVETNNEFVSDEEIDQLYDYIRGLAPLPDYCNRSTPGIKPPPPPIDSIPSRKSPGCASGSRSGDGPLICRETSPSRRDSKNPIKPIGSQDQARNTNSPGGVAETPFRGNKEKQRLKSKSSEKVDNVFSRFSPKNTVIKPDQKQYVEGKRPPSPLKPRPLSMVLPDNIAVLPRVSHYPLNPPVAQDQCAGPSLRLYQQRPPVYHSFANLAVIEEPCNEGMLPSGCIPQFTPPPAFFPMAAAPPRPMGPGFPNAAVYPRYVPRYQFQPSMYRA